MNRLTTSDQLAIAWIVVALAAAILGLAAVKTDADVLIVAFVDGIGIVAALLALGNWTGWIRL